MDEGKWAEQWRAGIGGQKWRRLRNKTAPATALDFVTVGNEMAGSTADPTRGDAVDGIGFLLQMAGELVLAAGRLLSDGENYAGSALLGQITEIEHLTWTIKENNRNAVDWLRSSHEERMKNFTPAQLRKTAKGRFLDKDYQDHCEQGGHPTVRGISLLGGRNKAIGQLFMVDLLTHSWRTCDQVAVLSRTFAPASGGVTARQRQISLRLYRWGQQDPIYKLMVERFPDK